MVDRIIVLDTRGHEPLHHERMTPAWQGGKVTDTEARELVTKLRRWAGQFQHPEAQTLQLALDDVERCFARVWTEIDEALSRINMGKHDPRNAAEHLRIGLGYLHRWQDRGGRVGNIDLPRQEVSHD
jgi:hypothetical protein